jgi:hypothetical protein
MSTVLRNALMMAALALLGAMLHAPEAAAAEPATTQVGGLDEVLGQLAKRQHARAHFNSRQYLALLDHPLLSSGELLYDAPDHLEQRITVPKAQTLIYDHGQLLVIRGHRHYQFDARSYPQLLPFLESIRATLAGDRAALEGLFHLDFSGDISAWTVMLIPIDANMHKSVSTIRLQGSGDSIRSVEIRQPDGDRSQMTIEPAAPQ